MAAAAERDKAEGDQIQVCHRLCVLLSHCVVGLQVIARHGARLSKSVSHVCIRFCCLL